MRAGPFRESSELLREELAIAQTNLAGVHIALQEVRELRRYLFRTIYKFKEPDPEPALLCEVRDDASRLLARVDRLDRKCARIRRKLGIR